MTLFTRKTSTGSTIVAEYGRDMLNHPALVISLDGKVIIKGQPEQIPATMRSKVPAQFVAVVRNAKHAIPLTAEEVAAFAAARASDPEAQAQRLRSEREALVRSHNAIADDLDAARVEMWDKADEVASRTSPALDAARAALEAFDAAHPEVKAAIEAERAAALERNRWM
jgi:hypothetical protein